MAARRTACNDRQVAPEMAAAVLAMVWQEGRAQSSSAGGARVPQQMVQRCSLDNMKKPPREPQTALPPRRVLPKV